MLPLTIHKFQIALHIGVVMKKLYPLLLTLVIAASVCAQSSNGVEIASAQPKDVRTSNDGAGRKIGGVEVPAEKLRPVTIPKFASPIVIDGKPDETAWADAAVFKDFYQTSPGDNIAASKPTEVRVMYDEKNLYISFKCWDEKDKIRSTVAKRDNVFGEDNVRVWLDTYDDQRRAYVLGFNPLGIQQDGIFTEGQGADFSVDIVMESKGVIEDWGWSVEVKIPFKSLRYSAGNGKKWGFNVARNIDRLNDEFDQWLPDDRNVSGFLIKHGKITGLDEIKYERTLEVTPSVTFSETGRRVRTIPRFQLTPSSIDPGRFVNEGIKQDIGVTLKYTISPNITLDAAINPDFAEIEADAPVVTANQRFPIFFQEKRPFFLEGQDTFNSPMRVFYSRNIVDPDFAAKLTGKVGKTSFGFLAASDKAPGNYDEDDRNDISVRPRIDEFLDKSATFAVLRVKRDFGKENNIGFFSTYRSFPEQKNLLGGIDGRIKINPKMTSVFQVVGTTSRRCFFEPAFDPSANASQALRNRQICGGGTFGSVTQLGSPYQNYRTGNGIGYYGNLDYTTEKHGWFLEVGGRSKFYRADSGFTRRTNTNSAFFYHRLSTKSDAKKKVIRASWAQFNGIDYDWTGRLQQYNAGTNVNLTLQKNAFLSSEFGVAYEKLYEEEFGLKRLPTRLGAFYGDATRAAWQQYGSLNFSQNLNKHFNYGGFVGFINNAYDYFGAGPDGRQNPGAGKQFDLELFAEYKPIDPLRLSVSYRKSRLVRNDNQVRAFDSDLVSLKSTYQFTRFVFARVRLDYTSGEENYSGQALLGWNPSPGTALYVGYNDNSNYKGLSPFTGQLEPGFERNSRTFFIRMSYLFRKSF
jgi:hypothetical protein